MLTPTMKSVLLVLPVEIVRMLDHAKLDAGLSRSQMVEMLITQALVKKQSEKES